MRTCASRSGTCLIATMIFIRIDTPVRASSRLRQCTGGELRNVHQLRRGFAGCRERVAKHRVAEGTGCADGRRARCNQFLGSGVAYAIAGFFAEKDEAAAGTATEASLVRARGLHHFAGESDDCAGSS